jgi:hypothetical protein
MVIAVVLEALQVFTPDRNADFHAALFGACGALTQALLAALFIRVRSAHIINWLSGRDVVTLGRGAQAPLRAWRPSRPLPMPTRSTHGMCVFHRRTSRSSTFTKVTT